MKNFFSRVFSTVVGILVFFAVMGILLVGFIFISSFFSDMGSKSIKKGSVLEIKLNQSIIEGPTEQEHSYLNFDNSKKIYFKDIIDMIHAAKDDENIKGISLKLDNYQSGGTKANEIREALLDFKKSKKFVYAYGNMMSQKSYYVSTVADSIFLNPMGTIEFMGLSAEILFFKNLGDKYGINFQVIRHGEYKSAVEPYFRTDLSEENRLQYTTLLNGAWNNLLSDISKNRKLSVSELNVIADSLNSFIPENALKYKLIDKLVQESEYNEIIKKKLNIEDKEEVSYVSLDSYFNSYKPRYDGENEVAVIYAGGTIMIGEGQDGIKSDEFKELVKKLKEDDDIKAVVLRVNSPGGSATASDEILFELAELKKKKPLVVSFGDVAASGGYYIAMAGDKIYSEKNTITGSIGVLGMVTSFGKLANNVGITNDYVTTNKNSLFYSPIEGVSPDGIKVFEKSINSTYNRFVNLVAKNRKKTYADIDAIARGRVWLGTDALKIGLVDQIGTLDDAIVDAAKRAKIDKDFYVASYPTAQDSFKEFMKQLTGEKAQAKLIKEQIGAENYKYFEQLKILNQRRETYMLMPNVSIN